MGKIHLPAKETDSNGNIEDTLTCPRCHNDESLGFATDGDRHCCRRCQLFFQTRNGDLAEKGLNRGSDPAISER